VPHSTFTEQDILLATGLHPIYYVCQLNSKVMIHCSITVPLCGSTPLNKDQRH